MGSTADETGAAGAGAGAGAARDTLGALALTLASSPLPSFAAGPHANAHTHAAAAIALQHIFTHAVHSETHAAQHIIPFLHTIHPQRAQAATKKRKRGSNAHQQQEQQPAPTKHSLFNHTPLQSLVIDGMDTDQLWAQLELRTQHVHNMINALIVTEQLGENEQDQENADDDDLSSHWSTDDDDDDDDDDGDQDPGSDFDQEPDGKLDLAEPHLDYDDHSDDDDDDDSDDPNTTTTTNASSPAPERTTRVRFHEQVAFRPIPPRPVPDSESESDFDSDDDDDDDSDDEGMHRTLTLTPKQIKDLANGKLTEADLVALGSQNRPAAKGKGKAKGKGRALDEQDSDEQDDDDHDDDDDDDEEPSSSSSTRNGVSKYNKHGFAEFDDDDDDNAPDDDDEGDEEEDGEFGIDLFQDIAPDQAGHTDAADAHFSDFFEKSRPASGSDKKGTAQPAKKRARIAEEDVQEAGVDGEEDEEMVFDDEDTAKRVSNDLFAEENQDEGPQARSRFEQRQAALRTEIAALERENVSKKDWTLRGEISAPSRPSNSLLEESLEFEQSQKRAPIITDASTASLEDRIKARILEGRFDDVQKRYAAGGVQRDAFLPSRMLELSDGKSGRSLAELYEEDYQAQSGAGGGASTSAGSAADTKLAAEHEAIAALFEEVCGKLDALSNAHYTPKAPKATIQTLTNAPAITLESALPSTAPSAARTLLAPEEVFQPATGALSVALVGSRSELTPEGKKALHERLRREKKVRNERIERGRVELGRVRDGVGAVGGKKGEKEAKEAALSKLIGNKGVSVIGKDGKNRTGKDALAKNGGGKKGSSSGSGKGKGSSSSQGAEAEAAARSGSKLKL